MLVLKGPFIWGLHRLGGISHWALLGRRYTVGKRITQKPFSSTVLVSISSTHWNFQLNSHMLDLHELIWKGKLLILNLSERKWKSLSRVRLSDPMDYTVHGILQTRILESVVFPFSRGIFPTQGLNPGLPHCRQILYQLSHKGSPRILE